MNEFRKLTTKEEWEAALELSDENPIVIFKHSSTCPISAEAHEEVTSFLRENNIPVYKVVVQESRDISNLIAEELGVKHESPQAIVLSGSAAVFDVSHYEVSKEALEEVLKEE